MAYQSLQEIVQTCEQEKIDFWEAILKEDMAERGVSREESIAQMKGMWQAMLAASENYDGSLRSKSGLSGGSGLKMDEYRQKGSALSGDFMAEVISEALKTGECNACMKKIVAAPTAGACGVLPAVLIPMYRSQEASADQIIEALYVAAGIGQVIALRAFIAGAAGGCQAEVGSASSMAAGALVHLRGGSHHQILDAAAMAMKMLLGLVCDPVAGLVEVPCIKRNVGGAVNAVAAADMALAGLTSRIPADEVIDAMKEVGQNMPTAFRETAKGGLANTKWAKKFTAEIKEDQSEMVCKTGLK